MYAFVRKYQCAPETLRAKYEGLSHNAKNAPTPEQRAAFERLLREFRDALKRYDVEI